jgi:hypothetical protein
VIAGLLKKIEKRSALLRSHGIEVRVDGCKISENRLTRTMKSW